MSDDRRLTFIIVPHGELETRTFQVSYRRLKFVLGAGAGLLLLVCVFLALWFPALTQAARVPGLERELVELENERARVAELAQTLAEVEAQYERVRQLLGADGTAGGELPVLPPLGTRAAESRAAGSAASAALSVWPIAGSGLVASRDGGDAATPGLDMAAAPNTDVRAAGRGLVAAVGVDQALGRYVLLDHGGGLQTLYGHASRTYVKTGEQVRAGQVIALSGSSGRSTAPHLHFEVRVQGRAVDPLSYIRKP